MKKNHLIFNRQWACSNLAVWLYLGNFLVFPIFHTTRNGVWQLNLIRKKVFGERLTYFLNQKTAWCAWYWHKYIKKKGLWRKLNVFLLFLVAVIWCLTLTSPSGYGLPIEPLESGGQTIGIFFWRRSLFNIFGNSVTPKWARVHRPPYKV